MDVFLSKGRFAKKNKTNTILLFCILGVLSVSSVVNAK